MSMSISIGQSMSAESIRRLVCGWCRDRVLRVATFDTRVQRRHRHRRSCRVLHRKFVPAYPPRTRLLSRIFRIAQRHLWTIGSPLPRSVALNLTAHRERPSFAESPPPRAAAARTVTAAPAEWNRCECSIKNIFAPLPLQAATLVFVV